MAQRSVPSTAFADAWIQVDQTENPRFFLNLLDATPALAFLNALARRPVSFLLRSLSHPVERQCTLTYFQMRERAEQKTHWATCERVQEGERG